MGGISSWGSTRSGVLGRISGWGFTGSGDLGWVNPSDLTGGLVVGVGLLLGSLGAGDNLELVGIKLEEGGGIKVLGPIRKTSPNLPGC